MIKMLKITYIIVAFSSLAIPDLFAENAASFGDSVKYEFKPITVTGQRFEIPKRNVSSSISIISRAQIREINFTNVADAVSYLTPGAFTTGRSNMGYGVAALAGGSITIRGIGGKPNSQILVLIDGRPDFQGIFGHPINDAYFMDNVERIEVLRGPASSIYGTNAMGGVVNIITRQIQTTGFSSRFDIAYGSYDTQKYRFQHSGNFGNLQYMASAGYNTSDTHRDNASFASHNYALKIGYRINRNYSMQFNASFTPYKFRDPGPEDISLNGYFEYGDITRSSMDVTINNEFEHTDGTIKIHGNFGIHDLSDGWNSEDQTNGIMAFQNFILPGRIKSTIGIDIKRYGGTSTSNSIKLGTFFNDERAVYLYLQKIVMKKLILATGLRLEDNAYFGTEWIPKGGLVFHPGSQTSLRANISKGFRTPSIKDLFLFPPANQNLKPERVWNYEIGMNQTFNNFIALDICGYYYKGDQLIQTTMVSPGQMLNQNTGSNFAKGFEISIQAYPADNLSANITYSYLDSDQRLPFAPDKFNFLINYHLNKLDLSLYGEFIKKLYASYELKQLPPVSSIEKRPDYSVVHFKFRYRLMENLNVSLSIENLLNREYEILKGYKMPGRTLSTNVSCTF